MVSDLAFELASSGKEVHVITSRQLYDKPGADLPAYEIAHGVHIHRVGTTSFGRSRLPGRAMDYLSFYFTSWRCALSIARLGDIIVAKTDPPMISLIGMAAAKQRGAKLVNWVQDVYPEIAIEFGVPFLIAPVRRLLFWLRDMSLKAATTNVVLGQLPARLVLSRGVPSDGVTIIHNWSDEDEIVPIAHADNTLRQAWGLSDKFVVGYSGNLGRTHEFLTMLSVSERFRNDHRIVFLVIGGGHQNDGLAHEVKSRGLERSYLFAPYQDAGALKYSLGVPDVHWISLRPKFRGAYRAQQILWHRCRRAADDFDRQQARRTWPPGRGAPMRLCDRRRRRRLARERHHSSIPRPRSLRKDGATSSVDA